MQFLPIVERELRVAARKSWTWRRRVIVVLLGLVVLAFFWLSAGGWGSVSQLGHKVFVWLSVFGFVYALLGGPLATVDSLSRERREGTLGLLFLTDLRGYDVVLGKLVASSLDIAFGLVAALPLLALPVLAGGVSLAQIAKVIVALANLLILSLAIGVFTSSRLNSGRTALAVTLGALLFLIFGVPILGETVLKIGTNGLLPGVFYSCCPLWLIVLCLNPSAFGSPFSKYWLNIAGSQLLAWALLATASYWTARYWREAPRPVVSSWWRMVFERWRKRGESAARRRAFLAYNPVAWLERRDRWQDTLLAVLVCGCGLFFAIKHAHSPRNWPTNDAFIFWPALTHYLLCLWIAIQAPRRFADDKQSGALELLLCTPLPVRQIVGGAMSALWRRFGGAILGFVLLDAFLVNAYVTEHGGWRQSDSLLVLCVGATIVFPLQGYALARAGIYHGLAKANSLRATFTLIWTLGLLPWAVFLGTMLTCEYARRYFSFRPLITERFVYISWTVAHLLVFAVFLSRASWQLWRKFRELAAGTPLPWWKRLLRLGQRSGAPAQ